jgi:hypothetical protein
MKRFIVGVLVLATCGFVVSTPSPALADTSCSIAHKGAQNAERTCVSNPATAPGAKWKGSIAWDYVGNSLCAEPAPCGRLLGVVTDTDGSDGSCAWVSMQHFDKNGVSDWGPRQITNPACGQGDTTNPSFCFNAPTFGCTSQNGVPLPYFNTGTLNLYIRTNHSSGRFFQIQCATKGTDT